MNYRWTYRQCEQLQKQRRTVRNIVFVIIIVAAIAVALVRIEQSSAAYMTRVAVINGN
jgi:hypothetical protein